MKTKQTRAAANRQLAELSQLTQTEWPSVQAALREVQGVPQVSQYIVHLWFDDPIKLVYDVNKKLGLSLTKPQGYPEVLGTVGHVEFYFDEEEGVKLCVRKVSQFSALVALAVKLAKIVPHYVQATENFAREHDRPLLEFDVYGDCRYTQSLEFEALAVKHRLRRMRNKYGQLSYTV
jgi:hypothetical protein